MNNNTRTQEVFLKEQYGFVPQHTRKITRGVMNSNFYFESSGKPYLFKVYNFKSQEEVGFETEVLERLKQKSFPAPRIVANREKHLLALYRGKPALVYKYREGMPLKEITHKAMRQIGALKGEMHAILGDFKPSIQKPRWDYGEIKTLIRKEGHRLIDGGFPGAQELLDFLKQELATISIPEDSLPRGVTHQDIKPDNIITKGRNVVGFVDFDNSYHGVLLHDITTTIIWMCFKKGVLDGRLVSAFLKGYGEERPLSEAEKENLPNAIRFRLLREAFIGPFVTLHKPRLSKKRSDYFLALYNNLHE